MEGGHFDFPTGHSSEPHLHFQLQDRADFYTAISLPIKFQNFERLENDTQECVELGFIEKDQMVHNVFFRNNRNSGLYKTQNLRLGMEYVCLILYGSRNFRSCGANYRIHFEHIIKRPTRACT